VAQTQVFPFQKKAPAGTVLLIDHLSKTFFLKNGQAIEALKEIHLEIQENEFFCLVGPSGCGKSTLLRIIAGLEQPTSGAVFYRGERIEKPRREIGMVFQHYTLLPWRNVEDNMALGLELRGRPRRECLEVAHKFLRIMGLEGFAKAYPYELSGGMQQRVAIARALANEPEVLLMDEPFGALDAHTRILLQKELLRIWSLDQPTIIFVTHSVDEAVYLADRIGVMERRPGRIKEIIPVDFPRPRDRALPEYGRLCQRLLDLLGD